MSSKITLLQILGTSKENKNTLLLVEWQTMLRRGALTIPKILRDRSLKRHRSFLEGSASRSQKWPRN